MTAESLLVRKRFTVEEYEIIVRHGILDGDRVELLDGALFTIRSTEPRHAAVISRVIDRLTLGCGRDAAVVAANPLQLVPHSEPEPDVMLLRPRPDGEYGLIRTAYRGEELRPTLLPSVAITVDEILGEPA